MQKAAAHQRYYVRMWCILIMEYNFYQSIYCVHACTYTCATTSVCASVGDPYTHIQHICTQYPHTYLHTVYACINFFAFTSCALLINVHVNLTPGDLYVQNVAKSRQKIAKLGNPFITDGTVSTPPSPYCDHMIHCGVM